MPPLVRWATPTARLATGVLAIAAAATLPTTDRGLGLAAALAGTALALTRPPGRWIVKMTALACVPVVAVVLPLALESHEQAARVAARALSTLVLTLGFASTQRLHELGGALRGVGVPRSLAAVLTAMARQAERLAPEGRRLLLARELRHARGGWVGPEVLAQLLVRSTRRAERVALAGELRGAHSGARAIPLARTDAWLLGGAMAGLTLLHWAARAAG